MSLRDAWALGVDLAWSPKNSTGVALARISDQSVRVVRTSCVTTDDEIVAFAQSAPAPLTIAIDAPTVVPNVTGMRDCDRQLQKLFARHHAGPYPANRQLLGKVNSGMPRGETLSARFASERGAVEGLPTVRHRGVAVMEVFPAPALVRLFALERSLVYKKKRKRSWETCRAGLSSYIESLRSLTAPPLVFDNSLGLNGEKGVAYKRIEDQVDSVLCAYLAALAWLYGNQRLEMIGTIERGYVVVPRATHDCNPGYYSSEK